MEVGLSENLVSEPLPIERNLNIALKTLEHILVMFHVDKA
jgi:hypothetical protein